MSDDVDAAAVAPNGRNRPGSRATLIPLAAALVVALVAGGVSWALSHREDCIPAKKPQLPDAGWDTVDQPGGSASGSGATSASPPAQDLLVEKWCVADVRARQVVTTGGVLFAVGSDDELRAIDATTGATWWSASIDDLGYYGADTGPVIAGDVVVVGASSGAGAALLAFDRTTGARVWTWEGGGFDVADLAVSDGLLYASVDGFDTDQVAAVDSTSGTGLWSTDVTSAEDGESNPQRVVGLAIGSDEVLALIDDPGSAGGLLRALELDTGTERWSRPVDAQPSAGPVIEGGRVTAFGHSYDDFTGYAWSFDVDDGSELWRLRTPPSEDYDYQSAVGSVAAAGDLVFALGDSLVTYDATTGDVLAGTYASPFGGITIAGDRLLTCNLSMPLGATEGDTLSYELADGSGMWCPDLAVVANGTVYAIDDGDLRAFGPKW